MTSNQKEEIIEKVEKMDKVEQIAVKNYILGMQAGKTLNDVVKKKRKTKKSEGQREGMALS